MSYDEATTEKLLSGAALNWLDKNREYFVR